MQYFYIGIKGVIYNPDTKRVLVLSAVDQNGKNFWDIPGGRINGSETIEQTLKRELNEEITNLGIEYKVGSILNAFRLPRDLKNGYGLMLLFYRIEARIKDAKLNEESNDYRWVNLAEIDSLTSSGEYYIDSGYEEALRLAFK